MRFETDKGRYVTAPNRETAERLAAQYGLGKIVARAASPRKRAPMSLQTARRLYVRAMEWPRCGQDWPADARERQAKAVLEAAGEDAA